MTFNVIMDIEVKKYVAYLQNALKTLKALLIITGCDFYSSTFCSGGIKNNK